MNEIDYKAIYKSDLYKKLILRLLSLTAAILLVFTSTSYAQMPSPTTEFYHADYAGLLNEDTKTFIRSVNLNYEALEEKPQVVVATVPDMGGLDIETYAVELFEKWKIGDSKLDNGVLIILALEERKIRIEVGYGLEGAITDGTVGQILDRATPFLSEGDYNKGILQIFYDVTDRVNLEYGYDSEKIYTNIVERPIAEPMSDDDDSSFLSTGIILFILFLIIVGNGGGRGGRRRSYRNSSPFGGGGFGGFPGGFGGGGSGGGFGGGSFGGGGSSGGGGGSRGF